MVPWCALSLVFVVIATSGVPRVRSQSEWEGESASARGEVTSSILSEAEAGSGSSFSPSLDDYSYSVNLEEFLSQGNHSEEKEFDEKWSHQKKREWLKTLLAARQKDCLIQQYSEAATSNATHDDWCPRVWDQMLCWAPTPRNTTVYLPCPPYVPGLNAEAHAWRRCGPNGSWEGKAAHGTETQEAPDAHHKEGWTNYTHCLSVPTPTITVIGEWLPSIKQMSVVGYSVSLATLLISFVILASLRKLRCPRNLLHLHLFASFMLRALVVLLKSSLLVEGMALPQNFHMQDGVHTFNASSQTWTCKLMICVWQYFILANYSWLLMEGLYLHSLIFMALFTDSSAITLYVLLGWGLPLGCVGMWAAMRATLDDRHCWTVHNERWIFWLCIRIPVAISNLINFFFFLNVVRVLILKLKSSISAESMKYRKLGKSTLVLVPLFGVHYFVLWGLSTSTNPHVELAWLFLDQVFASFQGFFVAVLYCLMNGEVRQELRKLYNRWYKGDPLVITSQSTLVSHTKTYASRGRTSIHSIHSAMDRRDRQTPSPQMYRAGGESGSSRPRTPSPSPTNTLTPSYGSRQQSRDVSVGQASSESYEEAIELRPRKNSDVSSHKTASAGCSGDTGNGVGTAVEILINIDDAGCASNREADSDNGKQVRPLPVNNGPVIAQGGQANGKAKEKHLTFSESTEQLLNAKSSLAKENGCVETGRITKDVSKGTVCVNVNKSSLKSCSPLQVDTFVVKKPAKGKEAETML